MNKCLIKLSWDYETVTIKIRSIIVVLVFYKMQNIQVKIQNIFQRKRWL